jgi:hypothetical protein
MIYSSWNAFSRYEDDVEDNLSFSGILDQRIDSKFVFPPPDWENPFDMLMFEPSVIGEPLRRTGLVDDDDESADRVVTGVIECDIIDTEGDLRVAYRLLAFKGRAGRRGYCLAVYSEDWNRIIRLRHRILLATLSSYFATPKNMYPEILLVRIFGPDVPSHATEDDFCNCRTREFFESEVRKEDLFARFGDVTDPDRGPTHRDLLEMVDLPRIKSARSGKPVDPKLIMLCGKTINDSVSLSRGLKTRCAKAFFASYLSIHTGYLTRIQRAYTCMEPLPDSALFGFENQDLRKGFHAFIRRAFKGYFRQSHQGFFTTAEQEAYQSAFSKGFLEEYGNRARQMKTAFTALIREGKTVSEALRILRDAAEDDPDRFREPS